MICHYAGGAAGARSAARAGAHVVVVDAFRASATIAVLVSRGASVIPLSDVEAAKNQPADLRVGERGGEKVEGFDFGNSPTEILASTFPKAKGATVAMTTTNGTRVVEASKGSSGVSIGSFINAGAVSDYLLKARPGVVYVVGCGWRGKRSSEDEAAAGAILRRLSKRGASLDERAETVVRDYLQRPRKALRENRAARRLKRLGYERDLAFCLAEDTVPVVPVLVENAFVSGPVG